MAVKVYWLTELSLRAHSWLYRAPHAEINSEAQVSEPTLRITRFPNFLLHVLGTGFSPNIMPLPLLPLPPLPRYRIQGGAGW